jgi:DNA-binding response OmpR family regulator
MNRKRILIVESEILVRHPLSEYLRGCGFDVIEAANSDEAQRVICNGEKQVDIVLGDVNRWGEFGFALANWIRTNSPGTQVTLAGTLPKTVEKAGELCSEGSALTKPYDHRLVLDHIRQLLAARERGSGLR